MPERFERPLGLYFKDLSNSRVEYLTRFIGESTLRDFFSDFPEIHDLEDFSVLDINYYIKRRRIEGSAVRTIKADLKVIEAFFQFCCDALGYHIINPAALRKKPSVWLRRRGAQPQLDALLYLDDQESQTPSESCIEDKQANPLRDSSL